MRDVLFDFLTVRLDWERGEPEQLWMFLPVSVIPDVSIFLLARIEDDPKEFFESLLKIRELSGLLVVGSKDGNQTNGESKACGDEQDADGGHVPHHVPDAEQDGAEPVMHLKHKDDLEKGKAGGHSIDRDANVQGRGLVMGSDHRPVLVEAVDLQRFENAKV